LQNRRAFFVLILAIVLGAGAALTAKRWLEQQLALRPPPNAEKTRSVTVVRSDLAVGSALSEGDLITVDWPTEFAPEDGFASPDQVVGRVLRRPLAGGEPVLESALLPEGARGGLVSVIDPTRRAISVKVDPVVGVAGFVVPGSHVDVLATLRRIGGDSAQPVSKVILQDVQVLAIDQQLEEAKGSRPELVQVVTLEVSPEQAEKLTFAAHEGKLQLALRNPDDREIVATHSVGVNDVLDVIPPPKPAPRPHVAAAPKTNVEVIKGAEVSVESF